MKKKIYIGLLLCILILAIMPVEGNAAQKVKLNKTKATMYVGSTLNLKVTGTRKKPTWKVANKKYATVSKTGKVTAKKAGTTKVTAKVSGKTLKCNLTIRKPFINKSKLDLKVNEQYALRLTGTKIQAVSSDKEAVATVNKQGIVTAKSKGMAKITLTGKDKKKYFCTVTVEGTTSDSADADVLPEENVQPADVPDNHVHIPGEWQTVKEPTCTEYGIKVLNCKICGVSMSTETIESRHAFTEIENTVSPENGGYIVYACEVCGEQKTGYHLVFEEGPHRLYDGDTYQIKLRTELDEKLLPYIQYVYECRYYNDFTDLEDVVTVSDNGCVHVNIKEYTNKEMDLYTCVNLELKENPYHAYIERGAFYSEIGGYKSSQVHEKIKNQILPSIITEDMHNAQKVLKVHDWICENIYYDHDTFLGTENATMESYEAYGAMMNGKAVCAGYAYAFQEFMDELNIPCDYVASFKLNHAWNQVKLDGEWYWLDCTWDDKSGKDETEANGYSYFLRNGVRVDDQYLEDGSDVPECTGKKWKYLCFEEYLVNSYDEILSMLKSQEDKKYAFLVFHDRNAYWLNWFMNFRERYRECYGEYPNSTWTEMKGCDEEGFTHDPHDMLQVTMDDKLVEFVDKELALCESHAHTYTSQVTAPNCFDYGYTKHACDCGYSYVDTLVDPLGHEYSEWTVVKIPTETEDGQKIHSCNRCHSSWIETLTLEEYLEK